MGRWPVETSGWRTNPQPDEADSSGVPPPWLASIGALGSAGVDTLAAKRNEPLRLSRVCPAYDHPQTGPITRCRPLGDDLGTKRDVLRMCGS